MRDRASVALAVLLVVALVALAASCGGGDGELSGTQVSIEGAGVVIDGEGQWVGDPSGLVGPQGPQGVQGPPGLSYSPLDVALLRWYPAIGTGSAFTVWSPYGMAFDGANIWVASYTAGRATKL